MMISELPKGSFFSKRGNREVFDMKMATRQKKWHQFLRQQSFILVSAPLVFIGEAAWPSVQRVGLTIQRFFVLVPF